MEALIFLGFFIAMAVFPFAIVKILDYFFDKKLEEKEENASEKWIKEFEPQVRNFCYVNLDKSYRSIKCEYSDNKHPGRWLTLTTFFYPYTDHLVYQDHIEIESSFGLEIKTKLSYYEKHAPYFVATAMRKQLQEDYSIQKMFKPDEVK